MLYPSLELVFSLRPSSKYVKHLYATCMEEQRWQIWMLQVLLSSSKQTAQITWMTHWIQYSSIPPCAKVFGKKLFRVNYLVRMWKGVVWYILSSRSQHASSRCRWSWPWRSRLWWRLVWQWWNEWGPWLYLNIIIYDTKIANFAYDNPEGLCM